MIVNIRGTGGAGKSTVVREIMKRYRQVSPVVVSGRKQPLGYLLHPDEGVTSVRPLYVVGHYETPCGGCDTITKPEDVFTAVRLEHEAGFDVLFEGIICQDDTKRTLCLPKAQLLVLHLDTPLAQCLEGIQARRDARGDIRPLNPKNTTSRAKSVRNTVAKLKAAGVRVVTCTRETAVQEAALALGWTL